MRPRPIAVHERAAEGLLPVLGLTSGDPNGIGPEIALRALRDPGVWRVCRPLLVGSPAVFEYYRRRFRIPLTLLPSEMPPLSWGRGVIPVIDPGQPRGFRVAPGTSTRAAGELAGRTIGRAADLWRLRVIDAIVTGPVSKETLNAAGYRYPGQTEFFAAAAGAPGALMIMLSGTLRIALATIHVPLRRVPALLTGDRVRRAIRMFIRSLREDFGLARPRLAVLGLNPHAGEGGLLGAEERDVIIPAVRSVRVPGATVSGPFPADGFFGSGPMERCDGILAMYHDQGLIPLKMSGFGAAVNFTAGLPLVRTSPGHGTAPDIAGKGIADPGSTVAAIRAAAGIIASRSRSGVRR